MPSADKEVNPKSFRITDDTAEKFKEISSSIKGNQQETMAKLIEAFEFQQGKAILTDKKEDIEAFEKYVTILTRMYMNSLEDNQNVTETVKTQFDALLKSKDATIQDLQEKLTIAKQLKEETTEKAKKYADESTELNTTIRKMEKEFDNRLTDLEKMLSDKDNLNMVLTDSCNDLKSKVESMTAEHEELKEKSKLLDKITVERDSLAKDNEHTKQLLQEQHKHEADALEQAKNHESESMDNLKQKLELKQEKSLLVLEKKYQEQIVQLKEEKQKEIDKYQQKYYELLERINSKEESLPEE